MSLITRMRKQDAIYWPPAAVDAFGRKAVGALVELVQAGSANYRVRWVDMAQEFVGPAGDRLVSRSTVYVPLLPDGSEVAVGGWLWLGVRANLTSETVPADNPGAYPVQAFNRVPNLRATELLRSAVL